MILPWLLRPAFFLIDVTSDFSGSCFVISENREGLLPTFEFGNPFLSEQDKELLKQSDDEMVREYFALAMMKTTLDKRNSSEAEMNKYKKAQEKLLVKKQKREKKMQGTSTVWDGYYQTLLYTSGN